ncbi:MAG: hypothetical protein ACREIR_09980 [Geminicoccaceae bacterium]
MLSLAIGLAALEAGGRLYATAIAKKGKLFRPDLELGWTPLPNLDLTRRNANGDPWHIVTDAAGIRGPSAWPDDGHTRLLVLGDSFAFGEGVDLAERFDTLVQERLLNLAVVNLGVMGYGPDQQLIRARHWKPTLRRGDVLLVLTYGNDFYDLARTRHGGRSKPWLQEVDGRLLAHKPAIDVFDLLRDRSYVFTLLTRSFARLGQSEPAEQRLENVGALYRKWVLQEVEDLVARGVVVVIVHHGDRVFQLPFDVDAMFERTCPAVSGCLALDDLLADHPRDEVFLEDGHWAAGGHRVAAEQIVAYLRTLPGLGPDHGDQPERRQPPVLGQDDAGAPSSRL